MRRLASGFATRSSAISRVGDEQERVEQLVDTLTGRRGDVEHDRVATPLLGHELLLGELLTHARRVGVFAVGLGDRDDDRHLGRTRRG